MLAVVFLINHPDARNAQAAQDAPRMGAGRMPGELLRPEVIDGRLFS
jgi:hypothetical protein